MKINNEAYKSLDIDDVLILLCSHARTDLGRNALIQLEPAADMQVLISRRKLLAAYIDFSDHGGEFPWNDALVPVSHELESARGSGLMIGEELLKVRNLLTLAADVKECSRLAREKFPALSWFYNHIREFDEELAALAVLQSNGTLSDGASSHLRSVRDELRTRRGEARAAGNRFLTGSQSHMLQERVLSMRGGRFTVLVKQAYINRFPGIVADKSVSGNSVYMEPHGLVEANNRIVSLVEEQRQEERRIYREITKKLLRRTSAIAEAENSLAQLDLLYCMDELITAKKWTLPELVKRSEFRFHNLTHPLLGEKAVPIDVYCGQDFRALIVTGPNTGGKTVALKTSALAVFLTWCGLPVPADEGSKVGTISSLYADIGDEQSIEQSLSTFSSHLKRIVTMLDGADGDSLVLLDELGAGTDPQEGAALGISVLEEFLRRGTLVLATTHHNPIKRFATTTAGVEAACVDFDMETLSPTYHLLVGIPGQSNALAIAQRYGMPMSIVKRAEDCLNSDELNVERLIGELQKKRIAVEKLSRELAEEKKHLLEENERLMKQKSDEERKREDILLKAEAKSRKMLDDAENQARDLLKSLSGAAQSAGHREMARHKGRLDKTRSKMERHQTVIEARRMPEALPQIQVGSHVKMTGSGVRGEVLSISGKKAEIQSGAIRVTVPLKKLELTSMPVIRKTAEEVGAIRRPEGVPAELNIRGLLTDEAMPQVERYLDRAVRAGYDSVTIIHGRGQGILRHHVHKLCDNLPYVKQYRLGERDEGGWGVTVINFK